MNTTSIAEVQQSLIADFSLLPDWTERYKYIIELGQQLPEFPDALRTEDNKIHGCLSQVWMHTTFSNEQLHVQAISDSAIVSGLIAILLKVYNNRSPKDILATPPTFIKEIGLDSHLSPNRNNGLHLMVEALFKFAGQH